MTGLEPAWLWLVHAAVLSTATLGVGFLLARLCREPVKRVRIIEWALVAGVLAVALNPFSVLPRWSLGLLVADRGERVAQVQPAAEREPGDLPQRPPRPRSEPKPAVEELPAPPNNEAIAAKVETAPAAGLVEKVLEPAATPVATAAANSRPIPWRALAVVIYLVGSGTWLAWWLTGAIRLVHLHRSTRPAPAWLKVLFDQIVGQKGHRVQLLCTDRIGAPVAYGALRPVVLLPEQLCEQRDITSTRFCLAHEWSHIEKGDVRSWQLVSLLSVLFYFQPFYWLLRRQLLLCQDYLADARAAEQAGAPEDYADFLITLARRRLPVPVAGALGIGDGRSNLYRRIVMLLGTRKTLAHRCRWGWHIGVAAAALAFVGLLSTVRLDAADDSKTDQDKAPAKEAPSDSKDVKALDYTGKVTDKDTGKPIEGATVTVRRSIFKSGQGNKILQETKHNTDKEGKYSFTIPPEQVREKALYIELDVEHREYAPQKGFGYALGMILKDEKLGGRPFFESVELRPGKAVTGRIETPDGKPAAGIKVMAYSITDKTQKGVFEYGSFSDTRTDAKGQFRLVLVTPGQGALWILPAKDYVPTTQMLADKRGDLGLFGLKPGIRIKGKVVDTEGKPLAGVMVNAVGEHGVLPIGPVADQINRSAKTNDQGEFAMEPLPPGTYRVQPDEQGNGRDGSGDNSREWEHKPLPAVFVEQKVVLKEGEMGETIEVRAVPHVVIEAQYYDSKGKERSGHEPFVFGKIDKKNFFTQCRVTATGKVTVLVPHGLEGTRLQLSTNEHSALRWRKSKDQKLQTSHEIDLGTVTSDVKGIEIIRYEAPIALVKVTAKDGAKLKNVGVGIQYIAAKGARNGVFFGPAGKVIGDVFFEDQEDGRYRSSQLLPDEEFKVVAKAEGYKLASSDKMSLTEGTIKEIEIVLEKE